ncbi:hypothetical protein [Nocardioides sp.]|uniref:hypothetical protein n=1 Tax=Nocardioides sp. TaxID=35761 RepID=UPI002B7ADE78|nr:hypothetical protein [Nocardioides sp.]HXH78758.1 hypothetical protein [Nocardioides sp.]
MSEVEDESIIAIPRLRTLVDSRRSEFAAAAAVCFLILAVLGVVVQNGGQSLRQFDNGLGTPAEEWSARHPAAVQFLLAIELIFGTVGTVLYVLGLLLVLFLKEQRRASMWSVVVMVGTAITTITMKLSFRRQRPQWEDSVHTLTSFSFPSGHASGFPPRVLGRPDRVQHCLVVTSARLG